jgi:hypothetical protein
MFLTHGKPKVNKYGKTGADIRFLTKILEC